MAASPRQRLRRARISARSWAAPKTRWTADDRPGARVMRYWNTFAVASFADFVPRRRAGQPARVELIRVVQPPASGKVRHAELNPGRPTVGQAEDEVAKPPQPAQVLVVNVVGEHLVQRPAQRRIVPGRLRQKLPQAYGKERVDGHAPGAASQVRYANGPQLHVVVTGHDELKIEPDSVLLDRPAQVRRADGELETIGLGPDRLVRSAPQRPGFVVANIERPQPLGVARHVGLQEPRRRHAASLIDLDTHPVVPQVRIRTVDPMHVSHKIATAVFRKPACSLIHPRELLRAGRALHRFTASTRAYWGGTGADSSFRFLSIRSFTTVSFSCHVRSGETRTHGPARLRGPTTMSSDASEPVETPGASPAPILLPAILAALSTLYLFAVLAMPNVLGVLILVDAARRILLWPDVLASVLVAGVGLFLVVTTARSIAVARRTHVPGTARYRALSALLPLAFLPLSVAGLFLRRFVPQAAAANLALYLPVVLGTHAILRAAVPAGDDPRPIRVGGRTLSLVVLGAWLFYFLLGWYVTSTIGPHSGDEGHFRIQAESLWEDHDLDIRNNLYATRVPRYIQRMYGRPDAEPDIRKMKGWFHVASRSREPHWYSWHSFGLAVPLALVHRLGDWGLHLVLGLISGLGVGAMVKLCERFRAARAGSVVVVALFALTLFWGIYSVRALPEVLGATLAAWMLVGITTEAPRTWTAVGIVSVFSALLPWVYTRFAPLGMMGIGLCGLRCLAEKSAWRRRILAGSVLGVVGVTAYALYFLFQLHLYEGAQPQGVRNVFFSEPLGMWHILSSRISVGYALPAGAWLLGAALWLSFTDRSRRWHALAALALFLSVLGTSASTKHWHGGACLAGRYLVCVFPLLVAPAAVAFDRQSEVSRWWLVFLLLFSVVLFAHDMMSLGRLGTSFADPAKGLSNCVPHFRETLYAFDYTGAPPWRPWAIAFYAATMGLFFLRRAPRWAEAVIPLALVVTAVWMNGPRVVGRTPSVAGLLGPAMFPRAVVQQWGDSAEALAPTELVLLAHLPLDGNGADALNAMNGAVHGATPAPDRHGNSAGALRLDGNAWLELPEADLAADGFSVAVWVRRTGPREKRQIFFSQGEPAPNRGLHVGFLPPDRNFTIAFYAEDLDVNCYYSRKWRWQHWAATYDAHTGMRALYCDGRMVACDFASARYEGAGPLFVGTTAWGEPISLEGDLDDLRIYRGALSPSAVAALLIRK